MTRKDYQFIAELLTDVWFLNYTAAGSIENGEDVRVIPSLSKVTKNTISVSVSLLSSRIKSLIIIFQILSFGC